MNFCILVQRYNKNKRIQKKRETRLDYPSFRKEKKQPKMLPFFAEREGFEPPVPLSTSVFKTDAIDHSAISPKQR